MCVKLRITSTNYSTGCTVYNTDYHQPMRWLRAMLLRLEQWRLMMPCASAAPRCGRRMQGCCRSRCAGCVADVGCWIVADAAVEGNATTIGAVEVNDAMCFGGTALRCMPGRSHSPGRGPGLTESASALRTSDAGLLPESLYRKRCGRRM